MKTEVEQIIKFILVFGIVFFLFYQINETKAELREAKEEIQSLKRLNVKNTVTFMDAFYKLLKENHTHNK